MLYPLEIRRLLVRILKDAIARRKPLLERELRLSPLRHRACSAGTIAALIVSLETNAFLCQGGPSSYWIDHRHFFRDTAAKATLSRTALTQIAVLTPFAPCFQNS